jgi:hypothetical protein
MLLPGEEQATLPAELADLPGGRGPAMEKTAAPLTKTSARSKGTFPVFLTVTLSRQLPGFIDIRLASKTKSGAAV